MMTNQLLVHDLSNGGSGKGEGGVGSETSFGNFIDILKKRLKNSSCLRLPPPLGPDWSQGLVIFRKQLKRAPSIIQADGRRRRKLGS